MEINGREVKFFYSVGAYTAIANLCPQHSFTNLSEYLSGNYGSAIMNIALILNQAYHNAHPEDDTEPLTKAELENLPQYMFTDLDTACNDAMTSGSKVSVETEPDKKKKKVTSN